MSPPHHSGTCGIHPDLSSIQKCHVQLQLDLSVVHIKHAQYYPYMGGTAQGGVTRVQVSLFTITTITTTTTTTTNCIERRNSRVLQSPYCAANCLQHVRSSGTVVCTSSSASAIKFDSWNRIYFSFILLAETINRWRRGGNRSTRRKPLTTSFRKCHILKPENSRP